MGVVVSMGRRHLCSQLGTAGQIPDRECQCPRRLQQAGLCSGTLGGLGEGSGV